MTAILLDTNAFAMALTDDQRLPLLARDRLVEAVRAAVSVISFYEIGQKVRLGKWPEMGPHVAGLEARAREDGYDLCRSWQASRSMRQCSTGRIAILSTG